MKNLISVLQDNPVLYLEKDGFKHDFEHDLNEQDLIQLLKAEDPVFVITNGSVRFSYREGRWCIFKNCSTIFCSDANFALVIESLEKALNGSTLN